MDPEPRIVPSIESVYTRSCVDCICYFFFQMTTELEEEVSKINQNEPYIATLLGEESYQFFVIAERKVFIESSSFANAITDMICAYFVFDISYPKSIHPILFFIQRFVLGIKDKQPIPSVVTRILNSLDKH